MNGKIIEMGDLECLQDCEEPNKSGVVILIDRPQLKASRKLFGEIVSVDDAWKTGEPPKDGTHIIAIGRIIAEGEIVKPYIGEIFWKNTTSGFTGWMYQTYCWPLSVCCSPDETFKIDHWIELPK
jgi:hypothetical protein